MAWARRRDAGASRRSGRASLYTVASVVALTVALAGCAAQAPTVRPSTSTPPAESNSGGAGPPIPGDAAGVVGAIDLPTGIPNDPNERKTVTVTSCARVDDGWSASGTMTNDGASSRKRTVTVFFTGTGSTVIGSGQTRVEAAPGETAEWTVSERFVAGETTSCILRGVG